MAPRQVSLFASFSGFRRDARERPPPTASSRPQEDAGALRDGVEEQPSLLEARLGSEPTGEQPEPDHQRGPGTGDGGTPGRFVSRLATERRQAGSIFPARLAPSVLPLQTSLFAGPVSADSGEGASGAHAVKAPPAPKTVLDLDSARYATGLDRLRPAGHRATTTPETIMEASPLASGQKGKAHDVLAAIRTLKQLEQEHRPATPEERQTLARFGGFGAVALSLFPDPVTGRCKDAGWQILGDELNSLLTPEEYGSAKRTTFTAFYTSP